MKMLKNLTKKPNLFTVQLKKHPGSLFLHDAPKPPCFCLVYKYGFTSTSMPGAGSFKRYIRLMFLRFSGRWENNKIETRSKQNDRMRHLASPTAVWFQLMLYIPLCCGFPVTWSLRITEA